MRSVLCGIGAILLGVVMAGVLPTLGAQSLDKNTDFYVVGVYEGNTHKYGKVTVFVADQDRPITLLLTAYESVEWQIEVEPGARLAKVLLSGYHDQRVSGIPFGVSVQTESHDRSSPTYMYGHDNGSCFNLVEKAESFYGMAPKAYLCQYRGVAFVVDHNGLRAIPYSRGCAGGGSAATALVSEGKAGRT
jgi:hypothetical protein